MEPWELWLAASNCTTSKLQKEQQAQSREVKGAVRVKRRKHLVASLLRCLKVINSATVARRAGFHASYDGHHQHCSEHVPSCGA